MSVLDWLLLTAVAACAYLAIRTLKRSGGSCGCGSGGGCCGSGPCGSDCASCSAPKSCKKNDKSAS